MGSSVVNALLAGEVEIPVMELVYKQRFEDGENSYNPRKGSALLPSLRHRDQGHLHANPTIFSTTDFKFNTIAERIERISLLAEGM